MSELIEMALMEAEEKMDKALEVAREDMASIRTGRAHPGMFAKIEVDYYGAPTPMQQLASFTVQDARTLLITPYDKGAMSAIEKALRDSDLGANPSNDGTAIRIVMPQLTEERRREYIKLAHTKGEDAKVSRHQSWNEDENLLSLLPKPKRRSMRSVLQGREDPPEEPMGAVAEEFAPKRSDREVGGG